jgi:hypothetical protein
MKKIFLLIIFMISLPIYAGQDGVDFGIMAGLSTPNDQINNVYNREYLPYIQQINPSKNDTLWARMLRDGAELGFHIGLRVKFPLNKWLKVQGSVSFHKFRQSEISVMSQDEIIADRIQLARLFTTQNVIPITAGADLYYINTTFFDAYLSGELAYNQFSFTTDVAITENSIVTLPVQSIGNYNSMGVTLGSGFDFNLAVVKLNLDVRYHIISLVRAIDGFNSKNFLSVSTAVYF